MTRTLPPYVQVDISDRDAAIIAGYLLRQREGTLMALDSTEYADAITDDDIGDFGATYYRYAEAYSRFLLWKLGYSVPKGSSTWDFTYGRSKYPRS